MASINDVTGDRLVSKSNTKAYEESYDRIFKNRDRVALLDGDIFMYRVGFSIDREVNDLFNSGELTSLDELIEDYEAIAKARVDEMIQNCLDETFSTSHRIFITCPDNFRKTVSPDYKANRTDKPKPRHLTALRLHLLLKWGAEIATNMEADDYLAIYQTDNTIICTIDKDLKQVVGEHYNFIKKEFSVVEELDGLKTFYSQFLIGDSADNIFGIKGVGVVGAGKYLNHLTSELELFNKVRELYNDDERMKMNGILLWMKRTLEDDWGVRFDNLIKDLNE